jgi:hypothetical protein
MKYLLSLSLLLLFVISCGHVNFNPPSGFVETKKHSTVLKMVAADVSVLKVSYRENKKNGTAKFWSTLMERELTLFKGYKLIKKTKYKNKSGFILDFNAPYKHKDFHYTVGILANSDDLYIVELGCEKSVFTNNKKSFLSLMNQVYKQEID